MTTEEPKCTLTDEQLLQKCDEWIDRFCETGGRAWILSIPPRHNVDPDLLFVELMERFKSKSDLFSAEMEKKEAEIKDLKFTAYARLKQIDLLEKRVEELETMRSAFESINSIKNIHLNNPNPNEQ